MIKVLIADDQELIRQSLSIILGLKEEISVVGGVGDGTEVLEFIAKEKPDIILMDIRMPTMDGVECTKIVKEKYPEIKIIVLTTFDDDKYVFSALKYGASGYLLKGISVDELEKAVLESVKVQIGLIIDMKRIKGQIDSKTFNDNRRSYLLENINKCEETLNIKRKLRKEAYEDWKLGIITEKEYNDYTQEYGRQIRENEAYIEENYKDITVNYAGNLSCSSVHCKGTG